MSVATPSEASGKYRFVPLAQTSLLILIALVFYYSVIQSLLREWYEHENFSYGFLIPFIFAYLIWDRRDVFRSPLATPSAWGAASFLGALVLGLAGKALGEPLVSRISLVLAIVALFQLFWGSYSVKRLAFPLCYLFLMVPPPYVIVKEVSYHLRMFDAQVATALVQGVGVPVYRDAYFMHLPDITLEVADICSGIASLFAMIALGTIYVYYLPARLSAKVLVLLGALICPLIANLFRLFLVTVSVYYYGPVMLGAFFHSFTGTFTFGLSLAMFLWLGETARRRYPQTRAWADEPRIGDTQVPEYTKTARVGFPVLVTVIIVSLLFYSLDSLAWGTRERAPVDLGRIATSVGPYVAAQDQIAETYSDPRAEQSLSRLYASAESAIEMFVGFNSRQYDENRLQSPKLVFPKGWEYASLEELQIPLSGGQKIDAVELLTKKNEEKRLVLFWYQQRGKGYSSDLRNRVELMKSLVFHGRTDGAVVRLATSVARFEPLDRAHARLIVFATTLYPDLVRVLPQ